MSDNESFFVSCALGNEKQLLTELQEFWHSLLNPDQTTTTQLFEVLGSEPGGILISCAFHLGLQINIKSKLANRVLWRLGEFQTQRQQRLNEKVEKILKARHLEKLHFNYHVVSDRSKLFHEGRISESLGQVLAATNTPTASENHKKSEADKLNLYLRIQDNQCVLSLDTSGEHLHRRGFAPLKSLAPLRETLAALMLRLLCEDISRQHLEQIALIDPCCGSGTLLYEGVTMTSNAFRNFDFQKLPFCPVFLRKDFQQRNQSRQLSPGFSKVIGYDYEKKAYSAASENLKFFAKDFDFSNEQIQFFCEDSLQLKKHNRQVEQHCLMIANLPYGVRVKLETSPQQMINQFHEDFNVLRSCWMSAENLTEPLGFIKKSQRKIKNQGLPVYISVFESKLF
jgi:putative N6-adenine-specific DNA methylase